MAGGYIRVAVATLTTARAGDHDHVDESALLELYRDCWLAPITDDAPLAEETLQPRAMRIPSDAEDEEAESPVEDFSADGLDQPEEAQGTIADAQRRPHKKKRPPRNVKIHRRHRDRLQTRKSNRCFIDSAWSAYKRTVQELAEQILGSRSKPPDAEAHDKETDNETDQETDQDDWRRTTPSGWRKDLRRFLHSLSSVIDGLCRVDRGESPTSPGEHAEPPDTAPCASERSPD